MAIKTLAITYRPSDWDDMTEQESIKIILEEQLETNTIKNAYLFCGPAGCGKTTSARIFANKINNGHGNAIEMDAASNSGVDDVRNIVQNAKMKSMDSEYKVYIIDECVTGDTEILTDTGWKRIDSITELDKVAQYTKDGRIEFVDKWEYVKKEYSGDMYDVSFRNGKRHVLMSPHHVQPTRKAKSKEIVEEYIEDCKFGQPREILVSGKGTGNNELLSSLDRLYIACQADGYCGINHLWELHLSIPNKIIRAQELLDDCGIDYTVYGNDVVSIRFRCNIPEDKKLASYFNLDMGVDRARDFISEILLWDGSTKSGYPGYYSCTDKDNVNFVSAVLTLCGYSGTVNVQEDDNPNHKAVWSVNWYYQDYRVGSAVSKTKVENFKGTIYCVKVPSQMIILRAEGFAFVSGNCHSISNTGWQAFLKLIEEPPAKTIFIFCTTDPQKIPRTILSRVQRYDFRVISEQGIFDRLVYILKQEKVKKYEDEALAYIAKLSEGHMRDAISYMDKCLSFGTLTLENVVKALGTVDYEVMKDLSTMLIDNDIKEAINIVEQINASGKDIKQFVNQYVKFLIDIQKWAIGCSFKYMQIPEVTEHKNWLQQMDGGDFDKLYIVFKRLVKLNSNIKWSQTPKYDLEAELMMLCMEE